MKYLIHSIFSAIMFFMSASLFLMSNGSLFWGAIFIFGTFAFAVLGMPE